MDAWTPTIKRVLSRILNYVNLDQFARDAWHRSRYRFADPGQARRNSAFESGGTPDGLPLPRPHLVFLTSGAYDLESYFESGREGARAIRDALAKNSIEIERLDSILDFGCGVGRILRHWHDLDGPSIHGTDHNRYMIDWCKESFGFARFTTNGLLPALECPDATFDLVYAVSVFTHLTGATQKKWLLEFHRIIKPGGVLLITTHGMSHSSELTSAERRQLAAGRLVVRDPGSEGSNRCATFNAEVYLRQMVAGLFDLIDFIPDGAVDSKQDQAIFRRI